MSEKRSLNYFDLIRSFAIILVVIGHSLRLFSSESTFSSYISVNSCIDTITQYIYTFHMPLFCIVSGGVYYINIEKGHYQKYGSFIISKLRRILIPYYSFSFFYVLPVMYLLRMVDKPLLHYIYDSYIISNNSYHLWYLMMLFIVFFVYHSFRSVIFKNLYISTIVFVLLNLFSNQTPHYLQIHSAAYYLLFFHIGCCIVKNVPQKISVIYCVVLIAINILLFTIESLFKSNLILIPLLSRLCSVSGSIGYFLLLKSLFENHKDNNWHGVKIISKHSFGIYLFHPMIMYVCFKTLYSFSLDVTLMITILFVTGFSVSLFLTSIVSKSKLKFIVGLYKK